MKKNKKHMISLIELICIIIIVSLLIIMGVLAIIRTIEASNENNKLLEGESLVKACSSYIDNNRDKAPKNIGEIVNIPISVLKEKGYLKADIYNSNKESCMNNSYVRVYKLNVKEYSYLPYIYCGKDKLPKIDKIIEPIVNMLFIDGNEINNNNLIFNNINESRFYIEMDGGVDTFGRQIELDSYEINIYMTTKSNPNLIKYYSSGVISANKRYTYTIDEKIMSYVNAEEATSIKVIIKVKNTLGGISEITSVAQSNNGN